MVPQLAFELRKFKAKKSPGEIFRVFLKGMSPMDGANKKVKFTSVNEAFVNAEIVYFKRNLRNYYLARKVILPFDKS